MLVTKHMVFGENVIGGMLLEGIVDCSLYQLYSSDSLRSLGIIGYALFAVFGIGGIYGALRDANTREEFLAPVATGVGALLMCGLLYWGRFSLLRSGVGSEL